MPASPASGPTAAILIIGEEILSGRVADENAPYLLRELRALGVSVKRVEVVPDVMDDIAHAAKSMSARYDHVFTSGGVGPTHDDVTLPAIALAFGMTIQRRAELETLIRANFGAGLHERDLRMADIPSGARLETGPVPGPGPWPVIAVNNVFILPGVPAIFRRKFEAIRELFRAGPIFSRTLYSRQGEGAIADALDAVAAGFPDLVVGSYPRTESGDYAVKITIDGRQPDTLERAAARLAQLLGPALLRIE